MFIEVFFNLSLVLVGAATAAEHSIATVHLDPPFVNSRLLVTKAEFGRVIGKGGQMIASIRGACGAGTDGLYAVQFSLISGS